jgi:hypothetical protein
MDITSLTSLINAFRAETKTDAITPESLGQLLQKIVNLLGEAGGNADIKNLKDWKTALAAVGFIVKDFTLNNNDRNSLSVDVELAHLATGSKINATQYLSAATTEHCGMMKAQQVTDLNTVRNNFQKLAKITFTVSANTTGMTLTINDPSNALFDNTLQVSLPLASSSQAGIITASSFSAFATLLTKAVTDVKINNTRGYAYDSHNDTWMVFASNVMGETDLYLHVFLNNHTCISTKLPVATVKEMEMPTIIGIDTDPVIEKYGTAGLMSGDDKMTLEQLKEDIDQLKNQPAAEECKQPYYHIECEAIGDELYLRYPQELTEKGYIPYLLRYTMKRNRLRPAFARVDEDGNPGERTRSEKKRGWHMFYGPKKIIVRENGRVTFGYHEPIDDKHESKEWLYSDDKEFLLGRIHVTYDDDNGMKIMKVGYGSKTRIVTSSARFKFGIVFAPPVKDEVNPSLNLSKAVTNIAEFQLLLVLNDVEGTLNDYHLAYSI